MTDPTIRAIKKSNLRYNEYYGVQEIYDDLYDKSKKDYKFKNLYEIITSEDNIKLAYRTIKSNTGSTTQGTDGLTINDFKFMSDSEYVNLVRDRLSNYVPDKVRRVEVSKENGKTRPLGIPTMCDRLIQQCFKQVLEPICEAKFYNHSYGFRPNRSTSHALARVGFLMSRNEFHYCVDIDIEGFFDNINHGKLLKQLWSMGICDKRVISIISKMLKAEIDGVGIPTKGTPQGGILSPLLANVALNELDWWIANQCEFFPMENIKIKSATHYRKLNKSNLKNMYIVRYADDFKIMCKDYETARRAFIGTRKWLEERLKLKVSNEKSKITNLRKKYSEFLGYKLRVTLKSRINKNNVRERYFGLESHVSDKAMKRMPIKLKGQIKKLQSNQDHGEVAKYNSMILGMHNYYKHATHVVKDFADLDFIVRRILYNRLKQHLVRTNMYRVKGIVKERYGDYKGKLYKLSGITIIPLEFVHNVHPLGFTQSTCNYTVEGRELIHKSLEGNMSRKLNYLCKNPVRDSSIEFNDNRISKFSAQKGKCAILKTELEIGKFETHHIKPRNMGGDDSYMNLVCVHDYVHKLIHATKRETIEKYIHICNLNVESLKRLNNYRKKVGNLELI